MSLQTALASAGPGSDLWVAAAVYSPGTATTDTFALLDNVRVLGGFIGNETSETQRNPSLNITTLSGELGSPGVADNVEVVVTAASIGAGAVLDGFHIVGAARNGIQVIAASPQLSNLHVTDCGQEQDSSLGFIFGGGMNIDIFTSPPVAVIDCEFSRNSSSAGGALYMDNGAIASFLRCSFNENAALLTNAGGGGAGVIRGGSDVTYKVCTFKDNYARNSHGGALAVSGNPSVRISHSAFIGNHTAAVDEFGGGHGGAIAGDANESPTTPGLKIHDCIFVNNHAVSPSGPSSDAGRGGALYLIKSIGIDVTNCLFFDNSADSIGGACFLFGNSETFTNCTIADCDAPLAGGAYVDQIDEITSETSTWRNVIIWNCTHAGANDETKSIYLTHPSHDLLDRCCIDDSFPLDSHVAYNFPTVIDVDPRFANETERAFQLRIDSPCVDAGNTPPVPTDLLDADLDLITLEKSPDQQFIRRVFDDPTATNSGVANDNPYIFECGYVDMGAFERQTYCTSGVQGDYDDNGLVNGLDIQPFVLCYLHGSAATAPCNCSDINMDGAYTFDDVTCLIDILLMRRWCEVSNDCPVPHEGGEGEGGEGEGRQMMMQSPGGNDDAGNAASGLGQKTDMETAALATPAEPPAPPPEEVEDPAFNARWNAYVTWLDANWIDQYPEMTEEEWNAWTPSVMIDMVYQGVAP